MLRLGVVMEVEVVVVDSMEEGEGGGRCRRIEGLLRRLLLWVCGTDFLGFAVVVGLRLEKGKWKGRWKRDGEGKWLFTNVHFEIRDVAILLMVNELALV